MDKSIPLSHRILKVIEELEKASANDIVPKVRKYVSAAQAAIYNRLWIRMRKMKNEKFNYERGVRILIAKILTQMCKRGKIKRIQRGVYAPMTPTEKTPE